MTWVAPWARSAWAWAGLRTTFTSGIPVSEAEPVQHLPEIGGGGGVNQRAMAVAPHGFIETQRRERIDEG